MEGLVSVRKQRQTLPLLEVKCLQTYWFIYTINLEYI